MRSNGCVFNTAWISQLPIKPERFTAKIVKSALHFWSACKRKSLSLLEKWPSCSTDLHMDPRSIYGSQIYIWIPDLHIDSGLQVQPPKKVDRQSMQENAIYAKNAETLEPWRLFENKSKIWKAVVQKRQLKVCFIYRTMKQCLCF